ncbi:hypothetical protein K3495_g12114 [Podosphaera aphanis]|nr:hypothetical protein K3495_g12114 [Podosphaera aphanis]
MSPSDELEDPHCGENEEALMLDPAEMAEEITSDGDAAMDSGSEAEEESGRDEIMQELELHNDSSAHFDIHKDSIFCIAQHPLIPNIVATGGSEGEDAGGMGFIFDATLQNSPALSSAHLDASKARVERKSIPSTFKIEGHTDSINALAFTLPNGEILLSGGLDGKLKAFSQQLNTWTDLGEVQEVDEINWLAPCPHPKFPNTVALGANDGSVWVYTLDVKLKDSPFQILQSYFLHTQSCTAGSWSNDGNLLASVSEDGSLYVWDVFGEAAAAGLTQGSGGAYVVGLTASDQRFFVDGGLFSVAIAPSGTFLAAGGAGGAIKIVGLPRLGSNDFAKNGGASTSKNKKQASKKSHGESAASVAQSGQILADLQAQSDGIETLAFAPLPLTLLAAGSVDGSIAIYDSAHRFAVRRHIKEAHEDYSVVKVEFVQNCQTEGYLLTSCGMDGVVRRWDTRGGTGIANSGFLREWKGHRGDGDGGGVLGFVQGDGTKIVTAGDDGLSLVFDAPLSERVS